MLIYNKIEQLRKLKKIPKMEFYKEIGMTDTGYRQAVENNSLKVITLEKIAQVLNCRLSELVTNDADELQNQLAGIAFQTGVQIADELRKKDMEIQKLKTELLNVY